IEGVYIPCLFEPEYAPDGTVARVKALGRRGTVTRRCIPAGRLRPARTAIFTDGTEFGHLGVVEVARGCPRGCRFCMASFCNRPVRFMSPAAVLEAARAMMPHRDTIGLLGSSVSDHPDLIPILKGILDMGRRLTVSSMRADRASFGLLELLKLGGQQTVTIAPEAGTERLRASIGKPASDESLFEVAARVAASGLSRLKLYFMLGLPGETMADIGAVCDLVKRMKHEVRQRSSGKRDLPINVSLSSFVPKAQTPFQWESMMAPDELMRRIKAVKQGLRGTRGVLVHSDLPKWAFVQGVLSRGDRRCSKLIYALAESDLNWQAARRAVDVNPEFYAARARSRDEVFPWAHIGGPE
ncbi:radical SAM protein, partial [bacterium]|nr:radical SAM protein [bacterium]